MSDLLLEQFREHQEQIQRSYDPSIFLVYNPRIERWLVCEDLRVTRKVRDPHVDRDCDLDGVPGVGEVTTLQPLFKCETSDGKPFPPYASLVIKILAMEHPKNGGNKSASQFLKEAEEKKEARWRRALGEKCQQVYEDAMALRMRGRRFFMGS